MSDYTLGWLRARLDRLIAQQDEIIALLREQMGRPTIRTGYVEVGVEAKAREVEQQLGPSAGQLIRDLAYMAQDTVRTRSTQIADASDADA